MSVPAGSLALFLATTLKDGGGQDAVLTHGAFGPFAKPGQHAAPAAEDHQHRGRSELPDAGFYSSALADSLRFRMTFSEPVTVSGIGAVHGARGRRRRECFLYLGQRRLGWSPI